MPFFLLTSVLDDPTACMLVQLLHTASAKWAGSHDDPHPIAPPSCPWRQNQCPHWSFMCLHNNGRRERQRQCCQGLPPKKCTSSRLCPHLHLPLKHMLLTLHSGKTQIPNMHCAGWNEEFEFFQTPAQVWTTQHYFWCSCSCIPFQTHCWL